MGKIILDGHIFERRKDFEKFRGNGRNTLIDAEKEILGLEHAGISGELCKKWKFPQPLTAAIRKHHLADPAQPNELAVILYAADNLMNMGDNGGAKGPRQIDQEILRFLTLDEKDMFSIMDEVNESVNKMTQEIF